MGRAGRGAPAPAAVPSTPVRGAPAPTPAQAAPVPPVVYALSAEGQLHTLGVYSGKDIARPLSWLPPNADASDLIALNNIVYTATMHGCEGVADGVWAVNLADQKSVVRTWRTEGGSPSGAPAFGSDGTLYVAVSGGVTAAINGYANAIVALDPNDLTIRDWFTDPSTDFVTAPVVFKTGAREVVAAATRDGSIVLLDAMSLGGPAHATALHRSSATGRARSAFVPGGLATWMDSSGTAWLLLPAETTVSAVKVSAGNGPPTLEPGWTSRQMRAPIVPLIINGVAFVVSSGEFVPQVGATLAAADRARQSVPAVLYALDAATGRELWSSGKTITSFAHGPAVWPGIGQVHVATSDNTVYAFGFPLERY
jgi:outer membrane protein assembly factor BamB